MQFGVDEAGKGPVLGSMFAAAVVADPEALPDGIDDSKNLSAASRESLTEHLAADPGVEIGVAEIPVARIDAPDTDMNTLTVEAQAEALSQVDVEGLAGYVDAGDADAERFGRRVGERIAADARITAEHSADERYPLVGAASVIAKVRRDAHVEALAEEYGRDLGSGYPSDSTTREFLETYLAETGELPACARHSWKTCEELVAAAEQAGLADF